MYDKLIDAACTPVGIIIGGLIVGFTAGIMPLLIEWAVFYERKVK
jgi:ABC-type methionine transport system permease subunit